MYRDDFDDLYINMSYFFFSSGFEFLFIYLICVCVKWLFGIGVY